MERVNIEYLDYLNQYRISLDNGHTLRALAYYDADEYDEMIAEARARGYDVGHVERRRA